HRVIPSLPQGERFPEASSTIDIDAPGHLVIETDARLDGTSAQGNGLTNGGTLEVHGQLVINGTGNFGVRNEAEGVLTSTAGSVISIGNVPQAALRNDGNLTINGILACINGIAKNALANFGTASLGPTAELSLRNTGLSAIENNGTLEVASGATANIRNTSVHGISNAGTFIHDGETQIGPNVAGDAIQTTGDFQNAGILILNNAATAIRVGGGGRLDNQPCGQLTLNTAIQVETTGEMNQSGLLLSNFIGGEHAINGLFHNTGVIRDMPESFDPANPAFSHDGILLHPIAMLAGGT